jgi:hypothetical protein
MGDRGRDALDMVDLGITINTHARPDFAVYGDIFSLIQLGYAHVDGKAIGIGNRQIGVLDHEFKNWGALVWGSEQKGSGAFDPTDPHQARPDQHELTERPRFDVGLLRLGESDNPPPAVQFLEVDRGFHLGWIGIFATVRPLDIIDFVLGWTTIDIIGDDLSKCPASTVTSN